MIHEIDVVLRRLLLGELAEAGEPRVSDLSQISLQSPVDVDLQDAKGPIINLYLHDVRENVSVRDQSFHVTRKPGDPEASKKRAAVRLDLSYLLTAHATDTETEHQLLSEALAVLLRVPRVPSKYLAGTSLEESSLGVCISVAQPDHPSQSDPYALWQALGGALRPTLSVLVSAEFDPFEEKRIGVVREVVIGTGVGTPPHGPRRPLDFVGHRVSVAGIVIDSKREEPICDATITVANRDQRTLTDERGFFFLTDLPPGKVGLAVSKRGYREQQAEAIAPPPGRPDQLLPISVAMVAQTDAEFIADEQLRLTAEANAPDLVESARVYNVSFVGRLRYSDGRPAAYIPVRVGDNRSSTDGDGVYWFVGLPPGEHRLVADIPGHGEIEVTSSGGPAELVIAQPPSHSSTKRT